MIKRILVPLDVSPFAEAVTNTACQVAVRYGAEVNCLTILDAPSMEHGQIVHKGRLGSDRLTDDIARDEQEASDRLSVVEAKFQAHCEEMNVPCSVLEDRGVPAKSIVKMAYYYDLVVMGMHSFFRFETNEGEDDTLAKVLAHSVTPMLCVPEEAPTGFENVCVIVDDSPDAARAICQFARFAKAYAPKITIATSGEDSDSLDTVVRATMYLKAQGFTNIAKPAHFSDPIKAISENWFDSLDLVVTGRHSSHRWHEMFHGNQATEIVSHALAPVFVGL